MPQDEQKQAAWPRTPLLTALGAMAASMAAYLLMPPLSVATLALVVIGAATLGAVTGYATSKSFDPPASEHSSLTLGLDGKSREAQPLTSQSLDRYTDTAIARGNRYIEDNLPAMGAPGGRLTGRNDQETAALKTYLASNPYEKEEMRQLTRQIIIDTIGNAEPTAGGRSVTYLAGPLGSKGILLRAAADGRIDTPEINGLREKLQHSVLSDFQSYKDKVAAYTGQDIEPYARWRGLLSGIDLTVTEIARTQGLNLVMDNTLAVSSAEEASSVARHIGEDRQSAHVSMTAVALTPAEAREEAGRQGLSPVEAEKTAHDFQNAFPHLCQHIPDVTLLDKDLHVLYRQVNFQREAVDNAPTHQERLAMQRHLKHDQPRLP